MGHSAKELWGCILAAVFAGMFILFANNLIDADNLGGLIRMIHRFIQSIGGY